MKLYITPGSPYARMARIVVLDKGLEELVHWADAHSPVGCTICSDEGYELQVEVVPPGAA
jgi:hypothetical protein